MVKAESGIGFVALVLEEEPLLPADEEDDPPVVVELLLTADVAAVLEAVWRTVLLVLLVCALLLSWDEAEVVVRDALLDATEVTPLVEEALNCEVEVLEDPLPLDAELAVEDEVLCR